MVIPMDENEDFQHLEEMMYIKYLKNWKNKDWLVSTILNIL